MSPISSPHQGFQTTQVTIVSASAIMAKALQRVLALFFPNIAIPAVNNPLDACIDQSQIIIVDQTLPFTSGTLPLEPQAVMTGLSQGLGIPVLPFGGNSRAHALDVIPIIRELAGLIARPTQSRSENIMARSDSSAWHELSHARSEDALRWLERVGLGHEARTYRELYEKDPEAARNFARAKLDAVVLPRASRVPAHPALASEVAEPQLPRKLLRILLVDDREIWRDRLNRHINSFNAQEDEYELDLRYAQNVQAAKTALEDIHGLQAVILDYYLLEFDFQQHTPSGEATRELAHYIREQRPELPVFGLTGQSPQPDGDGWWKVNGSWRVDRVFYKADEAEVHELLRAIIASVRKRSATPFFSALREYASYPTVVFHALPLSRGKSIAGSQWAREFAEFYGEGYFAGETSSTLAPMDTIFSPRGTLLDAWERAAQAFRADRTFFVTNGTTGANCIVYQALLKPGDVVLLDRNCHRSHHYAVVQSGAHVVYMEPEHIHQYGISSLVPLETIVSTVECYKDSAKILVLTHPTFEGLLYDPLQVIETVYRINPTIIFLFDEAWFAYGVFHPAFRDRSAMVAAKKLRKKCLQARVYVTQSIHKTLSGMRQGSMIHIHESAFPRKLEVALEEAFIAHTTTSPNVHILASLDVARMQADMEGFDRLSRALQIAKWIRHEFSSGPVRALTEEELATASLIANREVQLDPLKITLYVEGISGVRFREEELYRKLGIQINKYSHNTVLILVTIGTTWSMADHLVRSLKQWAPSPSTPPASGLDIPTFSGFDARYAGAVEGTGDLAKAYYAALQPGASRPVDLDSAIDQTSAHFVTPYPPGYPLLVPGQTISAACVKYIRALQTMGFQDIHGLDGHGRLFVLQQRKKTSTTLAPQEQTPENVL